MIKNNSFNYSLRSNRNKAQYLKIKKNMKFRKFKSNKMIILRKITIIT